MEDTDVKGMRAEEIDELFEAYINYDAEYIWNCAEMEMEYSEENLEKYSDEVLKKIATKIDKGNFEHMLEKINASEDERILCLELLSVSSNAEMIKNCINKREDFDLEQDELGKLILAVKQPDYIKEWIEDRKGYKFSEEILTKLIKAVGDSEYIKGCIDKSESKFFIREDNLVELIKAVGDSEYIKDYIDNNIDNNGYYSYRLSNRCVVDLIVAVDEPEYIQKFIDQKDKYLFSSSDVTKLIKGLNDITYIEDCIKNFEDWWIIGDDIVDLIITVGNSKLTMSCLKDWKRYGLMQNDFLELMQELDNPVDIMECMKLRKEYKIDFNKFVDLLYDVGGLDYIKKCIDDREEYEFDSHELAELIINFENEDIIFFLENKNEMSIDWSKFREKYPDSAFIKNNFDKFILAEDVENIDYNKIKAIIDNMYEKNNEVVNKIDLRMLADKYINSLGIDKINLISCFKDIQKAILDLGENEYEVFCACINADSQVDSWTECADKILNNISGYSDLISNIEDIESVDIEKLSIMLQDKNDFEIKTIEDFENFNNIRTKKCTEWINSEDINQKRKAVLYKIFGHSIKYSETIIKKFGEDINNIEDCDEKDYVQSLIEILNVDNPEVLEEIYENIKQVELVDKTIMERGLKSQYGKMFDKTLFKISDEQKVTIENEEQYEKLEQEFKGLNVYNAGTEFSMLITSVAAYVRSNPEDFKADWNRPAIASQHFCASYIRNDMLGRPPIPHVCYGFSQLEGEGLMLSGATDIYSSGTGFVSKAARDEKYYIPDNQINHTGKRGKSEYNEMDICRVISNNEKRQPDYIVAFREKGKIENIKKILKVYEDWDGKLPIVIVDVDECLKAERGLVDEMLAEYNANPTQELQKQISQMVRNNMVTNRQFCKDIQKQLEAINCTQTEEQSLQTQTVSLNDLSENYELVTATERQSAMAEIHKQIQQIIRKKEGQGNGTR